MHHRSSSLSTIASLLPLIAASIALGCVAPATSAEEAVGVSFGPGDDEVAQGDSALIGQSELEIGRGLYAASFPSAALGPGDVSASLKAWDTPIRAQGGRGWCTAFGTVGAMENVIKHRLGIDADLSEIDHWRSYQEAYMLTSVNSAANTAIAPESAWPYWGNPVANYKTKRIAKVKSYVSPQNRDEVLAELRAGNPLVLGFTTYSNFNNTGSDGRMGMPLRFRAGGHAVAVTGFVRDAGYQGGGYLIIKNSHGARWGNSGYGHLPLDYCRQSSCYFIGIRSVEYNGQIASGGSAPANPPPPPPPTPQNPDPTPAPPAADIDDTVVQTIAEHDPSNPARFRLRISGAQSILDRVAQVRYDVDETFGSGRYATSADRTRSFLTSTIYKTYDHNWRTNGTQLRLKDGTTVDLSGAVIRW